MDPRRPAGQTGGNSNDPVRRRYWRSQAIRPTGPVLPLPVVGTIGVNGITNTTANVVGFVNPNGSATSWWVTYGTSAPLPGTNTASAALGSGTSPITVTFELTGLTTGLTYYVAVVGSSAAGTVYGATISFVAAVPITPNGQPVVPYGQPSVSIPHFNVPFSMVVTGPTSGAVVVEQDTLEEVLACVNTVAECTIGQCPTLPFFGRPDLTFSQAPVNTRELVAAIQRWEPRANEDAVSGLLTDQTNWGVTLTTTSIGAQGL